MSLSRHLAGLRARFDGLALRPPAAPAPVALASVATAPVATAWHGPPAGLVAYSADSAYNADRATTATAAHPFGRVETAGASETAETAGSAGTAGTAATAGTAGTAGTANLASGSALQAWCWQGAGPGHSAPWQPGARPKVAQRLAVAALRGPDAAATTAWANAFARQIDGSTRLNALPGAPARLALRLGVKAVDAMWWRARQPDDPWDAGWAINTPPALRHWKARFMPRRATLVLADRAEAAALQPCLAALVLRSDDLRHPVRWLWVGGADDIAPVLGLVVARFALG